MEQKKKAFKSQGMMSVPLVDSFSREEFYSQGKRFVFFVRHTNGDYLISLMAVLEVLYQVQRSELQAHRTQLVELPRSSSKRIFWF